MATRRRTTNRKKSEISKMLSILMWILFILGLLAVYQYLYKNGHVPSPPEPIRKAIDLIVPIMLPLAFGLLAALVFGSFPILGAGLAILAGVSLILLAYNQWFKKGSIGEDGTPAQTALG